MPSLWDAQAREAPLPHEDHIGSLQSTPISTRCAKRKKFERCNDGNGNMGLGSVGCGRRRRGHDTNPEALIQKR